MTSYGSTLEASNNADEFYHQENNNNEDPQRSERSPYNNEQHQNDPDVNGSKSKSPQQNGFMTYRDNKEDQKPPQHNNNNNNNNQIYRPSQNTNRSDNKGPKYGSEQNYQEPAALHNGQKSQSLSLEYGKTIRLLRNGDEFYRGHKFVINSRKYRYFDVFMDDISNDLNANFGAIRKIHTPTHGHRIRSLDELEDGKTYVANGNARFRKINYSDVLEGKRPAPNNRLPAIIRTDYSNFVVPQYDTPQNAIIYIYRNGDSKSPPVKILLYKSTMHSYDAVLDQISNKIKLPSGPVFKLFSLEGDLCHGSSDILSGNSYVAANKERFKRVHYLSAGDGSPRGYVRKTNSQPSYASTSSTNTNSSHGQGPKYNGWRKENSNPNSLPQNLPPVQNHRVQKNRAPINVDDDESGFFKAKADLKAKEAEAVSESVNMFVDLPVDQKKAREVEDGFMTNRSDVTINERPPVNPNSKTITNSRQQQPEPEKKQNPVLISTRTNSPSPVHQTQLRSSSPVASPIRSPSPNRKQASPVLLAQHDTNRSLDSVVKMNVDYDRQTPVNTQRQQENPTSPQGHESPFSNMDDNEESSINNVTKIETPPPKEPTFRQPTPPLKETPREPTPPPHKETPREPTPHKEIQLESNTPIPRTEDEMSLKGESPEGKDSVDDDNIKPSHVKTNSSQNVEDEPKIDSNQDLKKDDNQQLA